MAVTWHRTGVAIPFEPSPGCSDVEVGWSWRIARVGFEPREVRVEVTCASGLRPTDLPAAARNAIRSRGASAVDLFLDVAEPPERLVVLRLGVHRREQAV